MTECYSNPTKYWVFKTAFLLIPFTFLFVMLPSVVFAAQFTANAINIDPQNFTVQVTNAVGCTGTYTINAAPVAGSGPGGTTPTPTTTTTYIGFPQGNFLFANATQGQYTVTVTETAGSCTYDTNPMVFTVTVPAPQFTAVASNITPVDPSNTGGSFTIQVGDGIGCTGTFTVNAAPVAGSGPGGTTPAPTTVTTYIGFPQGAFLFANATQGQYTVTVTETNNACTYATDPVVFTVTLPMAAPPFTATATNIVPIDCIPNSFGSFTIQVGDGAGCAGTFTVNATPVAGSGPGAATPAFTTVTTYIGFPQGAFLFANATEGQYTVTVTQTGNSCVYATNPVVLTVTVPPKPVPTSNLIASQVDVCPNTEVTLNAQCSIPTATVNWNPGAPTVTPNAPDLAYVYKASCTLDGCTGNESSVEVRTHRILVDLKNVGVGVQPKALSGTVKDNLAPTNAISAPSSPRLWTILANGCSASESAVFKLTGPVNFSSIDNNPPYAIFANTGPDYFAVDHPNYGSGGSGFPNGTYTLTVDLRSLDGAGGPFPKNRVAIGSLLATRTLQFTLSSSMREGVPENEVELSEESWLSIGQNPVNNEVVVRLSGHAGQSVELSLMNLQGQPIQQRSVVLNSVQQYEVLDVAQAASGMYLLQAVKNNQVKTLKVVKTL
ncbi:MAG: T9SS type A sorting domain-containing protein [Spirosomataceae bacterium]